ncbi:hypothetical protein HWV62_36310 [Athelia sp. TMB]|nr:hypothetical protein HWV62_36310 [Athelia sp. TMB]
MESVSRLRTILLTSLGARGAQHGEQELFDELMVHQQCLQKLFDVGPRSAQEQREIESGKTVVNGRSIAVNADFARQVIFLSQQLDCSEQYIAGLLHDIMLYNPNITTVDCIEAVIVEFHQRRRHLVDCLRYIFEAAQLAESANVPRIYLRLDAFTRQHLIPSSKTPPGGDATLAFTIFRELENLGSVIAKVQAAKQNAVSNTAAPAAQGGTATLGYDILNARLDSLKYERRHLADVLFSVSRLGCLSASEVQKMVDWLASNSYHAMTYQVLVAVLSAFDPVDPESSGGKARKALALNTTLMGFMKAKLDAATGWKDQGLKAAILLKWTLFLTEARHRDHSLESRDGFKTEDLETRIWNAVQGDAFVFLTQAVVHLQRQHGSSQNSSYARDIALTSEQEQQRELPPYDFKPIIFQAFETLVRSLITHASSELRKIKQRQEDLVMSTARTDRSRFRVASMPSPADQVTPRNDVAMLYSFIGLLYCALPPERALQFWGSGPSNSQAMTYLEQFEAVSGKLPTFLQWAVWSTQLRDQDMAMALYDMLAGLSKGQHCSELAYNFMARGGGEVIAGSSLPSGSSHYNSGPTVSWTAMFGQLEAWAAPATTQPQPPPAASFGFSSSQPWQHQPQPSQLQQIVLGRKDVLLAQAFLRVLSNVVMHSVAVRIAISGNANFRAIPTLVSLIPLGIPMELKGALFDALAAFCEPGAGVPGIEICKAVWTLMERLEVINVRGGSNLLSAVKGVEVELEEVEAVHKLYPATIPFLKLLSTLIHTPKRVHMKAQANDVEPINTTPETLGQPYRLPGIGPFIAFVIDNVFAKIPDREYLRPSDRWQTNDLCLSFIERCLASYDMESLLASEDDSQLRSEVIGPLLVHPGYDIMKRLLTNSPLQASILSYLVDGVEGFEKEFAEEEPFFRNTIIRVMRIVHRVLEIQDIFIDVLVPLLSEFDSASIIGTAHSRSYFTKFDQALSFGPQYVPAIAAYVAFPAHQELVLLSVKILSLLSNSPTFSNLATLIERSGESERILNGFRLILESENLDNIDASETVAEQTTGAGAPDREGNPEALEQAIRLAALDLFLQNTEHRRAYPNIAHFLLFGPPNAEQPIQDPHALGAHRTCIHVLLDLLNAGVPRTKGKQRDREIAPESDPLFVALPGLAERCYHVIYQLCVHPRTSDFTMRYLRTREDFFTRHLAAVPSEVPSTLEEPPIEVLYNDGSRVTSTVPALTSFLRLRSWILDLVALDLHVLTSKGHHKGITRILEILFGNEAAHRDASEGWQDNLLHQFQEVGQSHLRIIEFVQSLAFDWSDSLAVQPVELEFLGQLNLQSCIRLDSTGCEVVDRSALLSLLATAKRALHIQGRIVTPVQAEQLRVETAYILESCVVENHRREVAHAVATSYESWRRVLETTLMKCFSRLPHDRRENMLFDLLHVLPAIIRSTDIQERTAVLLSEAILSSITKLREDRSQQIIIQSAGGDAGAGSLPVERLKSLLRSLLECVVDNNRLELVRGNLYAALINYLHLVASTRSEEDITSSTASLAMSLSASTSQEDFLFSDKASFNGFSSQSNGARGSSSALESGSLAVMKNVIERLVATIARDAIDGTEVWKTVAFMSLDSLVQLSRSEKPHTVLSALVRHGILSNFIRSLKDSDLRLQSVLKPDPDDLNALYVYESKMSLFIRMAQTRPGAEKLLESQLLPTLTGCDYIDARPEADQSFMDQDTFLPSAIQRYHQLFMPVLQLVHGMIATLGPKHTTAVHQALDFLNSHRDTITILLKTDNDYAPLSLLEEIHLLVSLCGSVLPLVPKSEIAAVNSGFGSIHSAILTLAAKCLSSGQGIYNVRPQTDAELLSASSIAPGHGTETKFDRTVHHKERLIRKAMITYLGAASEFTEPEITLVLSPITSTLRQEDRPSRFTAIIPTVGDAVEALSELCGDLSETLKQIVDLSAELAARDHVRVDNIQEIIHVPDASFLHELDMAQKRSLVCRELERIKRETQSTAKTLLSTTEMLLLLLWRHVTYYAEGRHINNAELKASASHAMRFISSPDADTFRAEIGGRLAPVLQRLAALELNEDTIGHEWRSNQGYIEIMSRRMRDTTGLHDAEP